MHRYGSLININPSAAEQCVGIAAALLKVLCVSCIQFLSRFIGSNDFLKMS